MMNHKFGILIAAALGVASPALSQTAGEAGRRSWEASQQNMYEMQEMNRDSQERNDRIIDQMREHAEQLQEENRERWNND